MELVDKNQLSQFLRILFEDLYPAENEYIEIIYDKGNSQNYSRALNKELGENIDNLIESVHSALVGLTLEGDNTSIFPTTVFKTPKSLNTRSNEQQVRRASCWILEIEPKKQDKLRYLKEGLIPFDENNPESKKLMEKLVVPVLENLPEEIMKAVKAIYTTGGGINLIIKFKRPVNAEEIKRLSSLFQRVIESMLEKDNSLCLDVSSAKIYHAQRIVGTRNYKYKGFLVHFLKREDFFSIPFEPLDVDSLLFSPKTVAEGKEIDLSSSLEELETLTFGIASGKRERFKIEEILRQADIPSLFPEIKVAKEGINYYLCHCPFHPPDDHPSFCIYKNMDKDGIQICVDFHDGSVYNAISLARELYGYDFKEAVSWLAESLGLSEEAIEHLIKKKKKEAQEKAEKLPEEEIKEGATAWLESIGVKLDKVVLYLMEEWNKSRVEFPIRDALGREKIISLTVGELRNFRLFSQKLVFTIGSSQVFPEDIPKKQREDFLQEISFVLAENAFIHGNYKEIGISKNLVKAIISIEVAKRINALLSLMELAILGEGIAQKDDKIYIAAPTLYDIFFKNRALNLKTGTDVERLLLKFELGEKVLINGFEVFVFNKEELNLYSPEERKELISKALDGEEVIDISTEIERKPKDKQSKQYEELAKALHKNEPEEVAETSDATTQEESAIADDVFDDSFVTEDESPFAEDEDDISDYIDF